MLSEKYDSRVDNNDMKRNVIHDKNLIFCEVNGPKWWSVMYTN